MQSYYNEELTPKAINFSNTYLIFFVLCLQHYILNAIIFFTGTLKFLQKPLHYKTFNDTNSKWPQGWVPFFSERDLQNGSDHTNSQRTALLSEDVGFNSRQPSGNCRMDLRLAAQSSRDGAGIQLHMSLERRWLIAPRKQCPKMDCCLPAQAAV